LVLFLRCETRLTTVVEIFAAMRERMGNGRSN